MYWATQGSQGFKTPTKFLTQVAPIHAGSESYKRKVLSA